MKGGDRPSREAKRFRIQIYFDVLRAIHGTTKRGSSVSLYAIERSARLTYPRLKDYLAELRDAGLLGERLEITDRGYRFLEEVSSRVAPVLDKYGLWQESR